MHTLRLITGKGYQAKSAKRVGSWAKYRGNQAQEGSLVGVLQDSSSPAISCGNTCAILSLIFAC